MKRPFALLLLIFLAAPAFAAERLSPVKAEARVLKSRVKIGDEIRLLIQVDHPRKYTITPPDAKLAVAPFEVKRVDPSPANKGQNRVQQTFRLLLTVFQTGDLEVPPIAIEYRDENGDLGRALTQAVPVKVVSVGKKLTDKDDIRPIKGPVSTGLLGFWTGLEILLAALLFIILVVKVIFRIRRERAGLESRKPPHERVKIELGRLKDKGFLEEKNYKSFYSEFSDVLRRYLERRLGVEALERTTSELVDELSGSSIDPQALGAIREVLENADLVKFARLTPSYELAGRLETLLLDAVERTTPAAEPKKK